MRRLSTHVVALVACFALVQTAAASTLQIGFTGVDLVFDGTTIHDAGGAAGGNFLGSESDPLLAATFSVDGSAVGPTLTSDVFLDLAITNVAPGGLVIPASGGFAFAHSGAATFGIDLLSGDSAVLALDTTIWQISYSGGGLSLLGAGTVTSSIVAQDLPIPYQIVEGTPVQVSLAGFLDNVTQNGVKLTGFTLSGSGTIQASAEAATIAAPEPSAAVLFGVGILVAGGAVRRSIRARD